MEHTYTVTKLNLVEEDSRRVLTLAKLLTDYPYSVAEKEGAGKVRVIALCVNERDAQLLRDALTMLELGAKPIKFTNVI